MATFAFGTGRDGVLGLGRVAMDKLESKEQRQMLPMAPGAAERLAAKQSKEAASEAKPSRPVPRIGPGALQDIRSRLSSSEQSSEASGSAVRGVAFTRKPAAAAGADKTNTARSLGAGSGARTDDALTPVVVDPLRGKRVIRVASGEAHSVAVTSFGDLYTWGRGFEGQLGTGDRRNREEPFNLSANLNYEKIVLAECGSRHTLAITDAGQVYQWGELHKTTDSTPTWGFAIRQVGMTDQAREMAEESSRAYLKGNLTDDEAAANSFGGFKSYFQQLPLLVEGPLLKRRVSTVSAGYAFSVALTDDGKVFSWGFNEKGQLGLGHRFNREEPTLVESLASDSVVVDRVACGQQHTLLLSAHGDVYSCGLGVFGQLGHGRLRDELAPRRIEAFDKLGQSVGDDSEIGSRAVVASVACGTFYSMCVSQDGRCFAFGHSEYGQHGGSREEWSDWATGTREEGVAPNERDTDAMSRDDIKLKDLFHAVPRVITGLLGSEVREVVCGNLHTLAVTADETVFSWGWGSSGCLGHGTRRMCMVPTAIQALQGEDKIVSVAAGWKHTVVTTAGQQHSDGGVDFRALINDPTYSDMVFELDPASRLSPGRQMVHAHKAIVFSRCPRLHQMLLMETRFGYNDSKKRGCALYLAGVRLPVFMQLLLFLYCDYIKAPEHIARLLEPLARKLALPRLVALARQAYDTTSIVAVPPSSFKKEMSRAVDDEEVSDICFRIRVKASSSREMDAVGIPEYRTIWANRAIVAATGGGANYFARMFGGQFKEKEQAVFHLGGNDEEEVEPEAFTTLLKFIYSGDDSLISADNAIELLEVADRFVIDELKLVLESFVASMISVSTAPYLLAAADRFHAWRLKRCVVNFLQLKASKVALLADAAATEDLLHRLCSSDGFDQLGSQILRELDFLCSKAGLSRPGAIVRMAGAAVKVM